MRIPSKCRHCRWLTADKHCIVHSLNLGRIEMEHPVKSTDLEFLRKCQEEAKECIKHCVQWDGDTETPITNKDALIAVFSRTHPEIAETYKEWSTADLTEGFFNYCQHPERMCMGDTTFFGIMFWRIMNDFPTSRFIDSNDRETFLDIPFWLESHYIDRIRNYGTH